MKMADNTVELKSHDDPLAASGFVPHCETCGYEIRAMLDSAGPDSPCPECGVPLSQSSPITRKGSPWQRRISLTNFWLTIWQTLRHPHELFRSLQATSRSSTSLIVVQSIVASVAFISPWSGVFVGDPVRQLRFARTLSRGLQILSTVLLEVLLLAALLVLATFLLGAALNFYARSRGWALPRGMMRSILAHASVGWTVAAGAIWSFLTFWFIATLVVSTAGSPIAARALGETSGWLATMAGRFGFAPLPLVVFGLGAAVVARLALTGLKECRFANAPGTLALFKLADENSSKGSGQ